MKVVQLLDRFMFGGGERVAMNYQLTFEQLGCDNCILALASTRKTEHAGINLFSNYYAYIARLISILTKSEKPVWVVSHTLRSLLIAILLKFVLFGRFRICFVQHLRYSKFKLFFLGVLQVFVYRYIQITPVTKSEVSKYISKDKQFCLNNYTVEQTEQFSHSDNRDLEQFLTFKRSRKCIVFLGRITSIKRPMDLVELIGLLPTENYCALFLGEGDLRHACMTLVEQRGLCDVVYFAGFQECPSAFLKYCEIYFMSSFPVEEMMPMAVLECMELGLKVIGYPLQVNRYLLDSRNIFKCADYLAIAKAIVQDDLAYRSNEYNQDYGKLRFAQLLNKDWTC